MSTSSLVTMSTVHVCDRHDDEKHAAQLKLRSVKMNRPRNSGKRVDGVDRFSFELSRFVRLDRFQGLVVITSL